MKKGDPIPKGLRRRLLDAIRKAKKRRTKHGYIRLWNRDFIKLHPNKKPYQRWHRLATEIKLRRFLTPGEIVHHEDTHKSNNKLSNFEVKSRSEHAVIHNADGILRKPKIDLPCSIEECLGDYFSSGFCKKHYQRWWRYGDPTVVLSKGRPRNDGQTKRRDAKFRAIREAKVSDREERRRKFGSETRGRKAAAGSS